MGDVWFNMTQFATTNEYVCKIKNDFLCDQWELMEARNHECERE